MTKKRLISLLLTLVLLLGMLPVAQAAALTDDLVNLAVKAEVTPSASVSASNNGPEFLRDGLISDREGSGSYPGPRSRWHTWPNKGEQWASMTFAQPQEVHRVVWYALVDEGVNVNTAYPSIKVQVLVNGVWTDSGATLGEIVRYTGTYSDSTASDCYIYTFDLAQPVLTGGVRVVVNATYYAGATEMEIMGVLQIEGGFQLTMGALADDGTIAVTADVNRSDSDQTIYISMTDVTGILYERAIVVPAGSHSVEAKLDAADLAAGEVEVRASLSADFRDAKTYSFHKPIPNSVIAALHEEIKTPYEYDVILRPTGVNGDYDSDLVDNPNIFTIPGDTDYVYMTYVGHDGEGYRTGIARSKDLLTWEKVGIIMENGDGTTWDSYNAAGYIVRDHIWGQLPTPHLNEDGKYCMTYLASDTPGYEAGIKRAGVAFADTIFNEDGSLTQWTRHADPVLQGDSKYPYEKNIIWKLQAIYNEEDDLYYGFYNAATGPEIMCGATSPDLIHWTRMETNPLLNTDKAPNGGTWGSSHNADADVVKVGDYWVMHYFTATPSSGIVDSFAVSTDLVNWQKSYITTTARNSTWSSTYSHKPCVVKNNGVVYHYYCAVGNQGRVIAVDTSIDLSAMQEARTALAGYLTDDQKAVLVPAVEKLEYELRRTGGSLAEVEAALAELTEVVENLDSYKGDNLSMAAGSTISVSYNAPDSGSGPQFLNDGIISEREGDGKYDNGPRSRWHTYPQKGVQWAAVNFDGEHTVEQVVWYALVDEGVKPETAYPSVTMQILKDGQWVDSGVTTEPIMKMTGAYADTSYSDGYVYTFNMPEPVTTAGVRMVVDSIKFAGGTEFQVWGQYDTSDIEAAEAAIAAIGEVTADSGEAIAAARTAYDALSVHKQAQVANYSVLEAAEALWNVLSSQVSLILTGPETISAFDEEVVYTLSAEGMAELGTVLLTFDLPEAQLSEPVVEVTGKDWYFISQICENGKMTLILGNNEGANGDDTLCTLTMVPTQEPGEAVLAITEAQLAAYLGETETFVTALLDKASVTTMVQRSVFDVNKDGVVNLLDMTRAQRYYGGFHPDADVNDDNTVDITDLILIFRNYTGLF